MIRNLISLAATACFSCWLLISAAAQPVPAGSLQSEAAKKLAALESLEELPAGAWRMHPGDLPHGEMPELDDSAWTTVEPRSTLGKGPVWLRQWIEAPKTLHGYDLSGATVWFHIDVEGNGPTPQIVYFNGRRVALGEDLEPIPIFTRVQPGERVLVAVKLLDTVDTKNYRGTPMRIDFPESRPDPRALREDLLVAIQLLPTLSTNLSADQATLDQAVAQIELDSLAGADQQKFDASLHASRETLAKLRPVLQQATFHVTGNSHIDAAWLWPSSETVDVVRRTFGTVLQLMREYPDYTYTQSAAQYNEWIADKYPEMDREIKKRIAEGRWEVVGGMWVEPDLNMPDGEALARSLLVGKRWYLQHYGVDVRIGWNPDSFGYNWQLPQIYKKAGIDYFVTQKMAWNDTNQLPFKLFWWESPDGSKVLTYFPHDYGNGNLNPVRLATDLKNLRAKAPGLTESMDLYGVGDHGGGPTRTILDEGANDLSPGRVLPKMEFGTAQAFFSSIEKKIAPASPVWNYSSIADGYKVPALPPAGQFAIPTWNSELYFEYHRGVMTTQAGHKRSMRQSEVWTTNAEKFASLAWLDGDAYPTDKFTDSWKLIAFNNFHDLAAGSGIGVIYRDAQKDYDRVRWSDDEIQARALRTLSAHIRTDAGPGIPVVVWNPLAWPRSGVVTVDVQLPKPAEDLAVLDAHGQVLPSKVLSIDKTTNTATLLIDGRMTPAMGHTVLRVVSGKRSFVSDLRVVATTMENATLKVVVDPVTGCISSLVLKQTGKEFLSPGSCGNELQTYRDTPKDYDAWNIDPGTYDAPPTRLDTAESVQVTESGPVRAVVRIVRKWQSSTFVQELILCAGSDELVVSNDIDWQETHTLLKVAMPLAATSGHATYEIPYGSIERPTTRNNSWDKAQFEVPALRWADLGDGSQGLSLINDSKYGYDAAGNVLRLTLLRSPTWPDPDADRGRHHFQYAIYPHAGDWKQALTVRHGYEFNYPLLAEQVEAHTGALPPEQSEASAQQSNVVVTAMKKAEDDDALVFRLYEWAGQGGDIALTVPVGAVSAAVTNLLEKGDGPPLRITGSVVSVPVKPYEIVTVKVSYRKEAR